MGARSADKPVRLIEELGSLPNDAFSARFEKRWISLALKELQRAGVECGGRLQSELGVEAGESSAYRLRCEAVGVERLDKVVVSRQEEGLPVFMLESQSSRWESGGWDGYNFEVRVASFLMAARCEKEGVQRVGLLMGLAHWDENGPIRGPDAQVQIYIGLALSPAEADGLGYALGPDGYGEKPMASMVAKAAREWDLDQLLSPARVERELIDQAVGAAAAPGAVPRL